MVGYRRAHCFSEAHAPGAQEICDMLDAVNDFGTQLRLLGMFAPSAQATTAGDDYIFDARLL